MDPELKTIRKSTQQHKKYMVYVNNKWIHFGDNRYQQFKDSTPLKLYKHLDHGDPVRRERYYKRHGHTKDKNTAKYWSNKYLW